jgi:hypothetical protein
MRTITFRPARALIVTAVATLMGACAQDGPVAPDAQAGAMQLAAARAPSKYRLVTTLRRVTAAYHDLDAAVADGFVFLHGCEVRPGEGPVGMVYVHPGRLMDGVIDAELPDALVYEPRASAKPALVGVELAIPYALWPASQPPAVLGHAFQPEDEFGVYGLHVWVWRDNPAGMFEEANPRVSCGAE